MNPTKEQFNKFKSINLNESFLKVESSKGVAGGEGPAQKQLAQNVTELKQYKQKQLTKINLQKEARESGSDDQDIKNFLTAKILYASFILNKDKAHKSWNNISDEINKESRKKPIKRFISEHFHDLNCSLVCLVLEMLVLTPIVVAIEIEGPWQLDSIKDEIFSIYKERPKEAWLVLMTLIIVVIFSMWLAHKLPELFFEKENDRKECLNDLLYADILSSKDCKLDDVLKLYQSILGLNNDQLGVAIGELKLTEKPILEAYKILTEFLFDGETKFNQINDNKSLDIIERENPLVSTIKIESSQELWLLTEIKAFFCIQKY